MKQKNELNEYDWTQIDKIDLNIEVSPKSSIYIIIVKKSMDFVLALIAAIILLPVYAIIIVLIKITMPGPVFFAQERMGYLGVSFIIYKFRTMRVDDSAIKVSDNSKDEERITALGKILRRLKLDETPQIVNILKGEMAIVGPRPTNKRAMLEYELDARRLTVRPGLTGLAQVSGNTVLDWPDRVALDLQYIDTISFINDVKIILKTVLVVLTGEERFKKFPE